MEIKKIHRISIYVPGYLWFPITMLALKADITQGEKKESVACKIKGLSKSKCEPPIALCHVCCLACVIWYQDLLGLFSPVINDNIVLYAISSLGRFASLGGSLIILGPTIIDLQTSHGRITLWPTKRVAEAVFNPLKYATIATSRATLRIGIFGPGGQL